MYNQNFNEMFNNLHYLQEKVTKYIYTCMYGTLYETMFGIIIILSRIIQSG